MFAVPEGLMLNKFEIVKIPRPVDIVNRAGAGLIPLKDSAYTGDDEDIPMNLNKVEQIENQMRYDQMKAQEVLSKKNESEA